VADLVRTGPKRLDVRVSGGVADENRVPLGDLITIAQTLQDAMRGVGSVLTGGKAGLGGRTKGDIEAATELQLLAEPKPGSITLELGLAPAPEALPGAEQPYLGERALAALIEGMARLDEAESELPEGFDPGVLKTLKRLRPVLRRGYTLDLALDATALAQPTPLVHVDETWLSKVDNLIDKPLRAHIRLEGVLQMVDLGSHPLQCRIDRSFSPSVACLVPSELQDEVRAALGKQVEVTGEGEFDRGSEEPKRITVDELAIVTDVVGIDPSRFRQHVSWEELAVAQGVEPLADPDSLGGLFESDEELDQFLALRTTSLDNT
jgi:hypothetical protein